MSAPNIFDRNLLQMRRERAAAQGDMPDFLLRRAAEEISARLHGIQRGFPKILHLGAQTGLLSNVLVASHPPADFIVNMEASALFLAQCSPIRLQADEELLPFADGSFDLITSALTLQLVNDLPGALIQIRRTLKPDGLFLGAVLGGATLTELREAFMQAEIELEGGISPRVAPMAEIRELGALLQRAGFALPVADSDLVTVTYDSPLALVGELRAMGAGNTLSERRRMPLRRRTFRRSLEIYSERFSAANGRVKATFEIIYLAGWGPDESQQKPLKPGSAKGRLADALGVTEHKLKGA